MTPIDLIPFAEHSQKLPARVLSTVKGKDKNQTLKILAAHWLDFFAVLMIIGTMSALFGHGLNMLLMTRELQLTIPAHLTTTFMTSLVPFSIFNYFFFSYFMNHGQSWGMFMMRKRIDIKNKNFMPAFKWAAYSTLLCLSCGLTYIFMKQIWNGLKEHDHLYMELMAHKEDLSLNLLTKIDSWTVEELPTEIEEWQKAA